ncbi:hypothetical protein H1R17_09950 [Flavobacterium sp. xlx-214]|uniref:MutS-related protein n=1 Tax=unclassified Flavobacterium TaxID=196869 RepID=UPI0013D1E426|nr:MULTISPECIES: hypothetical protein [unclassified Flavobacterium]MBA5793439.1 hypothetical protein [Flavobacterium sp. xlx-221]QMI82789.1 hypothetical protein H1R17_09950 [Flavobacterium sp. xlx-214]
MDFSLIKKYFKYKSKNTNAFQIISDEIADDLNLDLLFLKVDRTISKIGKQYFYSKFRIITNEKNSLFNEYQDYFDKNCLTNVEIELDKLNRNRDFEIIELIENDIFINQKFLNYAKLSLVFLCVILFCSFFVTQILFLLIPLFLVNAYYHYLNKNYVEYYNLIISRLHKMLAVSENISKTKAFENEYKQINIKKLRNSFWTSNATEQLAKNEFLIVFWLILELSRIAFNLEIFGFAKKVTILNSSKKELLSVFEFIGKIDTANSISKIKKEYKTTEPIFTELKEMQLEAIYHPLLDDCIRNNLKIIKSSIVITGSNMSGKTSFMRVVAINTIFAQSLGFCFADVYKAPFMKIFTSISIQDDIYDNKSYYLDEVLRIKNFLEISPDFKLILIDEIFKGTNTRERIAISKSVLKNLNSEKNIVFVTSHDLEIASFLENYGYQLYYFSETVHANEIKFTYKINKGLNTKTNAIRILEMYNFPTNIIDESYKLLG